MLLAAFCDTSLKNLVELNLLKDLVKQVPDSLAAWPSSELTQKYVKVLKAMAIKAGLYEQPKLLNDQHSLQPHSRGCSNHRSTLQDQQVRRLWATGIERAHDTSCYFILACRNIDEMYITWRLDTLQWYGRHWKGTNGLPFWRHIERAAQSLLVPKHMSMRSKL